MRKIILPNEQKIVSSIEEIFFRGVRVSKSRFELHQFLQNNIAKLAGEFSLTPEKEFLMQYFREDYHNGYIDVVWAVDSIPIVAIEIDSSLREKSVRKLLALNSILAFWVYYGRHPFKPLVDSIDKEGKIKVLHFPFHSYGS